MIKFLKGCMFGVRPWIDDTQSIVTVFQFRDKKIRFDTLSNLNDKPFHSTTFNKKEILLLRDWLNEMIEISHTQCEHCDEKLND